MGGVGWDEGSIVNEISEGWMDWSGELGLLLIIRVNREFLSNEGRSAALAYGSGRHDDF